MAIIHILDKQNDDILGTLSTEKGDLTEPIRESSLDNLNTFDFTAFKQFDLLSKRNRLLVSDSDGFYHEYIINYAEQYKRSEKIVKSDASFIDLKKSKVIEPQVLQGATPHVATNLALYGTEWTPGYIEYSGSIRTINITEHVDPYTLLRTIASTFGLELRFHVKIKGNKIVGRYVDLVKYTPAFDGKEITFGKDLIGIKRKEHSGAIVTALLGLGPQREDGTRLTVMVEDSNALQRWGRKGQHLIETYEPESTDQEMTLERLKTLTENELKKRIDAIVAYECEAAPIENILGRSHEKIRLGQTIRIKDDGYTPPLYIEARIGETTENIAINKVLSFRIGNFKEYKKSDLEKSVSSLKNLVNDKIVKMVTLSVESSSGNVFKNGVGSTILTAKPLIAGSETDLDGTRYSYNWVVKDKNGKLQDAILSRKSITVLASDIDEKATYVCELSGNGVRIYAEFTITVVYDGERGPAGEDALRVEVISTNGAIFKAGNIHTVLEARVYKGGADVTAIVPVANFKWTRVSANPDEDKIWNDRYFGGTKTIVVTTADVYQRATFFCNVDY